MNKVILQGNLGRDPETRTFDSGNSVTNFSLATSERRKNGDSWEDHTEWHNCSAWGKTGENIQRFFQKGRKILVEGKMSTRKYEKDGRDVYSTEVVVYQWHFCDSKGTEGGGGGGGYGNKSTGGGNGNGASGGGYGSQPGGGGGAGGDDDIPF